MSDIGFVPSALLCGTREAAVYEDPEEDDFAGNPMIEALPRIWSEDEVVDLLQGDIKYRDEYRRLRTELRYYKIYGLIHLFVPLPPHFRLEQNIGRAIRWGYYGRNPYGDLYYWSNGTKAAEVAKQRRRRQVRPLAKATGFAVIGFSGVGKSTSVETILSLYPQIIDHSRYQDRPFPFIQVVWLKLDCPHDASLKGLCYDFFQSLDSLLDTNYFKNCAQNGRASVPQMLPQIRPVVRAHCMGLLALDELQNLSSAKSGGAEQMLSFLVSLENIGLPLLLIGTPKALGLFRGEFRQARRAAGQGDFVWTRMENGEVWRFFLQKLWEYQYTREVSPPANELSDALYDVTQGITDLAVKVYILAQMRAIASGVERVTEPIIRAVVADSLALARPGLDALRRGDYTAPEIEDIHLDLEEHMHREIGQLGFRLIDVENWPQKGTAEDAAPGPDEDVHSQKRNQPEREPRAAPTKKKSRRESRKVVKGGLIEIVARGIKKHLEPYEALKEAGFICSADEFLDVEASV